MRSQQLYCFEDPELLASITRSNELCAKLSTMTLSSADYRPTIEALIPGFPKSSAINPPFHCDHGHGITIGEHTFINYDCIMLRRRDKDWSALQDRTSLPVFNTATPYRLQRTHKTSRDLPANKHRRQLLAWRWGDHLSRCNDRTTLHYSCWERRYTRHTSRLNGSRQPCRG